MFEFIDKIALIALCFIVVILLVNPHYESCPRILFPDGVITIDDKGGIQDLVHVGDNFENAMEKLGECGYVYDNSGHRDYYHDEGITLVSETGSKRVDRIHLNFSAYLPETLVVNDKPHNFPISEKEIADYTIEPFCYQFQFKHGTLDRVQICKK